MQTADKIAALIRNADEEDKYRSENRSRDQRLQQHPEQSHDSLPIANGYFAARQHQNEFAVSPDVGQILRKGSFAMRLDDFDCSVEVIQPSVSVLGARTFQDGAEIVTKVAHIMSAAAPTLPQSG